MAFFCAQYLLAGIGEGFRIGRRVASGAEAWFLRPRSIPSGSLPNQFYYAR
jgi:hypothetical protein